MLLIQSATATEVTEVNMRPTAYETNMEHTAANIPTTAPITSTPPHHQKLFNRDE